MRVERVRELIRLPGPCITIFLPAYRPGEETVHRPSALLRTFVQEARRELTQVHSDSREAGDLLEPLRAMAEDPATDEGRHWPRVVFRSPSGMESYDLREPLTPRCTAGARFQILPLLGELNLPAMFYVLKISHKGAALFRAQFTLERLAIPSGVAGGLADFLELDAPDRDLENRSSAGPTAGDHVRFGTGNERETRQAHISDYYRALDRAMREVRPVAPLILAGVDEDTALYRDVTADPDLVEGTIRDNAPDREILKSGYEILRARLMDGAARLLVDTKNHTAPSRFTADVPAIVAAAEQGRVARLFLRAGIEDETANLAATETIRRDGQTLVLPPERMAEAAILAELRY